MKNNKNDKNEHNHTEEGVCMEVLRFVVNFPTFHPMFVVMEHFITPNNKLNRWMKK